MRKVENNLLTENQFTKLLIATMFGVGIMRLPNSMVKTAKQDGWITVIISAIYPLYILCMAAFLSHNYPNDNILVLSKKYLGNVLGSIMNFMFLIVFVIYLAFEAVGINNFLSTYIIDFLSNFQFFIVFIPITAFTAYKGLKVLSKFSELVFYSYITIGVISLLVLYKGSYLNLCPVFTSGVLKILQGVKNSLFQYVGIEMVLLIYPRISNKNKVFSSGVKGILYTCFSYTWVTFATIYYLGASIINKALWSSIYIIESVRVPVVNNFRVVAMFSFVLICILVVSLYYYSCGLIIKDFLKSISRKTILIVTAPIIIILCLYLGNEIRLRELIALIIPYAVIFNLFYVTIIVLLIFTKKVNKNKN